MFNIKASSIYFTSSFTFSPKTIGNHIWNATFLDRSVERSTRLWQSGTLTQSLTHRQTDFIIPTMLLIHRADDDNDDDDDDDDNNNNNNNNKWEWTVIRPGHPDPAGFQLTGEILLWPNCMWHGGSDFHELQYPFYTKSDVTAQLTVGISCKICRWSMSIDVAGRQQCALAESGANCSRRSLVPRSPAACRTPINVRVLYLWCKRHCCHTLVEWRYQQVAVAGIYWTAYRPHRQENRLSTDNAEKLLILKEILLKFWTGCDIEQCEYVGLVNTWLSGIIGD